MNKKQFTVAWWQILKVVVSLDYYLGFFPMMAIFYITRIISKPKSNIGFYRRLLYIQAIVCPITLALLLAILRYHFNLHFVILVLVISMYNLSVLYLHYTEDQYVSIVHLDDPDRRGRFSKRLKVIKLISFYCFFVIFALLIPE